MVETANRAGVPSTLLGHYETGAKKPPQDVYKTMDILAELGQLDQLRHLLELQAEERKELFLDLDGLPSHIINVIVNLRACIIEDSLTFGQWEEIGEIVKGECHADQMAHT